jgi:UDP-N-acetylglucosamine 2-epimerase (non-hydrolysing)
VDRPDVVCVVGTRPEVVKMAPVIRRLRRPGSGLDVRVLTTGQHRGLLDRALADFAIVPDRDLDLMRPDQRLADVTAKALAAIADDLGRDPPDLVLAQGDTTTTLATALACHFARVPFGHVEAGLRTGRPHDPFPEEKNRVVAGHLADLHFAPTPEARCNLLREGIDNGAIHVTGNTVIDALSLAADREVPLPVVPATPRFLLVTVHRRENFGAPLERICDALRDLVRHDPALSVVCPVHPNPHVGGVVRARLGGLDRVHLIEPVGYLPFVALMKAAALILTDSGGVQEEAPALGKLVLVLRETTERVEGIAEGETVLLVGTRREAIVAAVRERLDGPPRAGPARNPYGDGWASERIARVISARFGIDPGPLPCGFSPLWPAGGA